jgi:enamine deaminase RidA (YjgF/YER057c/UK114 family)
MANSLSSDREKSMRENRFPKGLSKRVVGGQTLYAPVVTVPLGEHTLVFVSGLLSRDPQGQVVGRGDMSAQIRQVGENLKVSLEAVGAGLGDLVRTCTFVTDIDEFFRHVNVRQRYLAALPTSTTVQVSRLSDPAFMVEIEALAVIPTNRLKREEA